MKSHNKCLTKHSQNIDALMCAPLTPLLLTRIRNPSNFISVHRVPFIRYTTSPNSRSVKNKSADIFDYACECKVDLAAVTETWFGCNDDAVIDCDSLTVKKVDAGEKVSFEFSEWTVQFTSSHYLRVVIIYRPQSDSDDRRIPTSTFFANFVIIWRLWSYVVNSWL